MPRVLVIEDAPATQRLIEMTLMLEGWDVLVTSSGESGLEVAESDAPDLVVLDIALPKMDGWQVLKTLRADSATASIPVIVVTAHDTAGSRTPTHSSTADGFLGKPFDVEALRRLAKLEFRKAS
ncbi:MAG: response regulator [Acidimicrobiia bacterium]|nr:response regulator [Acidimicrobiia bacterium]